MLPMQTYDVKSLIKQGVSAIRKPKKWRSPRFVDPNSLTPVSSAIGFVLVFIILTLCFISEGLIAADKEFYRDRFLKSYELLSSGKPYDFSRLSKGMEKYVLYPYLEYKYITRNTNKVADKQIEGFLKKYDQSPLAWPLRKRWLKSLAKKGRWQKFAQQYRPGGGAQLACNHLRARIINSGTEKSLKDNHLLDDIKTMWLVGKSQVKECDPAFDLFYKSGGVTSALIWQRIELAMEQSQLGLARVLARRLDKDSRNKVTLWRNLHRSPAKFLKDDRLLADTPRNRKIILHGIKRLARSDLDKSVVMWKGLQREYKFTSNQKLSVEQKVSFQAVEQNHSHACQFLDALQERKDDDLVQRYLLKCAITNQQWNMLEKWTRKPPAGDFNTLRWLFWRARALDETGKQDAARAVYRVLAKERDYYGYLAADQIDEKYRFNDERIPLNKPEREKFLAMPAIIRARELRILGLDKEARKEWSYATRNLSHEQLKKAAVIAHEWGWHDRVILTLGRARAYDDVELRFPMPFKSLISEYAKKYWLPKPVVYTLMRSESAFMPDARSSAGARGLMQLMPRTASETARKVGYPYRNKSQLYEPEINIALGTSYLKQMLNRYDNRLILAAAAYNAGPHRVLRWRPERGCVDGVEWVELIPFSETRRYVRKVLFYQVIYQSRLGEKIETVSSHLEPVSATGKSCS